MIALLDSSVLSDAWDYIVAGLKWVVVVVCALIVLGLVIGLGKLVYRLVKASKGKGSDSKK